MTENLSQYVGLSYDDYDCWQLIRLYYRQELGIRLPFFRGQYENGADGRNTRRLYLAEIASKIWIEVMDQKYPDLVLFIINGKMPHVGLVVNKTEMLHVQRAGGSAIENFYNFRWNKRRLGFYRYAGLWQ